MTPHRFEVRVYFADTDAAGVVYHANYLALAERARTEFLREQEIPHAALMADHGCLFMVRRANLEYLRPARLDDMLTITTTLLRQAAATLELEQLFALADGADCARLIIELACVRAATGKPARIPPRWRLV